LPRPPNRKEYEQMKSAIFTKPLLVRVALALGLLAGALGTGMMAAGEARAATTFTVNNTGDGSDADFSQRITMMLRRVG
jgi:hypothetical protein